MPDKRAKNLLPAQAELQIAMTDVVRFVRQLSHDLRNSLNAAELQAAFVAEIATDGEVKGELKRLREMVSELGTALQKLTASLGDVRMTSMPYRARDFVDDMQHKIAAENPEQAAEFQWATKLDDDAMVEIDPQLLQVAMNELIDNALRHQRGSGPITIAAFVEKGDFVLELREPKEAFKKDMTEWGREPLRTLAHGHYGLGLHRVQRILDAHQARFDARYDTDASALLTTIRLPLAQS